MANMELQSVQGSCGTPQLLGTMLESLSGAGGIYIGERVIMTRIPEVLSNQTPFGFAFAETPRDVTRGLVWAHRGMDEAIRGELVRKISASKPSCATAASYDVRPPSGVCVMVDNSLSPQSISEERTAFAELARWLFYGSRRALTVVNGTGEAIPRLAHYVWLTSDKSALYSKNLTFPQFLSILSALYVGGFQQVWVHGNTKPTGN